MKAFYKALLSIGIAVGVFCSLIVFSVGQRQYLALQQQNKTLESDTCKLIIQQGASIHSMSLDYARKLQTLLPEGMKSDPVAAGMSPTVIYNMKPLGGVILGTGENYNELMDLQLIQGSYFTREDIDSCRKVCVLSSNMYNLVKDRDAKQIEINGDEYVILGVMNEGAKFDSGVFTEGDIIVPITTLYKHIQKANVSSGFVWSIVLDKRVLTEKQITSYMKDKAKFSDIDITGVKVVPYYYQGLFDINLRIKSFAITFMISLLILVIAACNIIHITTASIMDREREIGLRTALGALSWHIVRQITGEIFSCVLRGGIAGVAIASVFNTVINLSFGYIGLSFNVITIISGMLLAMLAGLFASLLPAKKAVRMEPASALKEE